MYCMKSERDETYLEDHSTQLCGEQQLLALRDQGINHKMLPHVWFTSHISTVVSEENANTRRSATIRVYPEDAVLTSE